MEIGRIVGTVVCVEKVNNLRGVRFCIVQPLDHNNNPQGEPIVAVDSEFAAGYGETVIMVIGGDAAALFEKNPMPTDAAIVGILDDVAIKHFN
jgi:ethanolamine utilization protein EutN